MTLNLKVLTKIFFKLSCPKGNLCGGSVTVLNPKYPRLSSGDTISVHVNYFSFMPFCIGWVENFDKIALSRTVKKIEANFCFSIFGKNLKIQNGRHFWGGKNF